MIEQSGGVEPAYAASDADVEAFERDGAFVVRNVLPADRVARMQAAIDDVLRSGEAPHQERAAPGSGRFYNGFFNWLRNDEFRDTILNSALGAVAARFLRASRVNFFYDQLMVKEAQTPEPTPWHQDMAYFPVRGGKVLSIWTPFDAISPSNGPMVYVRGSHRWAERDVRPETFNGRTQRLPVPGEPSGEFEFMTWEMQPGDCLIHDGYVVHASPANNSSGRRRALATRWADQDVRFDPRPNTFWYALAAQGDAVPDPGVAAGEPLQSATFPQVWPRVAPRGG